MPTVIACISTPTSLTTRKILSSGISDAISQVLQRPSKLVHTYIYDNMNFPNETVLIRVYAHGGRDEKTKAEIGEQIKKAVLSAGYTADSFQYSFVDNPSGSILTGGIVRWAANDPLKPKES